MWIYESTGRASEVDTDLVASVEGQLLEPTDQATFTTVLALVRRVAQGAGVYVQARSDVSGVRIVIQRRKFATDPKVPAEGLEDVATKTARRRKAR